MKKIFSLLFILLLFLYKTDSVSALSQETVRGSYVVKPYLVIPENWRTRISADNENRLKNNILKGLEDAKQFYSSKLQGHTFQYDSNVTVVNAGGSIDYVSRGEVYCVDNAIDNLTIDPLVRHASTGFINIFFVVGSGDLTNCADAHDYNNGEAYISHQMLEQAGSSDQKLQRDAVGVISHELGHTFGLVFAGWALAHPCSIVSKNECIPLTGLGISIPYPPASEYTEDLMGSGLYLGTTSPNSGINNSIYNPEIQKIFKSLFINPNGDSAPQPTESPKSQDKIISVSPVVVTVGKDDLQIIGSGFGKVEAGFIDFKNPTVQFQGGYSIKKWTDSEIVIRLTEFGYNYPVSFELSVNGRLFYPKQIVIQPQIGVTPVPSTTPFPSLTPTPTSSVTPSPSTAAPSSTPNSNITKIKISNYKDFRDNPPGSDGTSTQIFSYPITDFTWYKSSLDPNSPIYIVPIKADGSTGDLYELTIPDGGTYILGSFTIHVKVKKIIVKIQFGTKEITSDFTQKVRIHLPGIEGQPSSFSIPVIITYSNGTTKSLFYSFNYNPLGKSTASPSATPTSCIGVGIPSSAHNDNRQEWGGSCANGLDAGRAIAVPGTCSCTVAQCMQYNAGPYCWLNNGQVYNDPLGCAQKGAALPSSCFNGIATPSPTPIPACVPTVATKCDIDCTLPENCGKTTTCDNNCTPITGVRSPGQCNPCK